ncbi:hypothetical protein [Pseudomonas sp. CFBP 13719]|uniref:hypothetical protein n=1 Tax=Pseudomonas sp. CFBP 13719 TaxID=2775303 RepID=UPI00177E04F4|nr:hypothetical protein [Pseudomonas sp. CFBP 13719]MBD8681684.1 hypothetical protein [Pseudomonas sp. CFBP 13719]
MKFKSLMLAALLTMPLMAHAENIIKVFAPINPSPGRWLAAEPTYGEWGSIGAQYGCSTWAPSVESALYGTTFTHTSSCSQDYQRTSQAREVNDITGAYRVVGNAATESKTSAVTNSSKPLGFLSVDSACRLLPPTGMSIPTPSPILRISDSMALPSGRALNAQRPLQPRV